MLIETAEAAKRLAILCLLPLCLEVREHVCGSGTAMRGNGLGIQETRVEHTLGHYLPDLRANFVTSLCSDFLICKMGEGTGSESPC